MSFPTIVMSSPVTQDDLKRNYSDIQLGNWLTGQTTLKH